MRSKDDGVRLGEGWDFRVADRSLWNGGCWSTRNGGGAPCEGTWKWLHHLDLGRFGLQEKKIEIRVTWKGS